MSDVLLGIVVTVVVIGLLVIGIGYHFSEIDREKEMFNNGKCYKCGNVLRLNSYSGWANRYNFVCEKCGNVVVLDSYKPGTREEKEK